MKVALILLVVLGFVALSQGAPAVEETALVGDSHTEAAMNELADPNCAPKGSGDDQDTAAAGDGTDTKKKGKKGGKGGKKGKGKKNDDEE